MVVPFELLEPAGLLALLALVPVVHLWRTSAVPQLPQRRWLGLAARVVAVTALALALAGARLVRANDRLTVIFCLDWSDSVDPRAKKDALAAIEAAAKPLGARSGAASGRPGGPGAGEGARVGEARSSVEDRAGLVVFGAEAEVEQPPETSLAAREPATVLRTGASDLGRAIRLAAASFPDDARKRIVIVSDGNENRGDAVREAEVAAASGIEIDAIGLETEAPGQEVLVESVRAPRKVKKDEVFDLDVVVRARRAGKAVIRVLRRGGRGETLLPPREVELEPGLNRISPPIHDRLSEEDGYSYQVVVESPDDANPSNNRGEALVEVGGETRILYAEGKAGEDKYLRGALEKAGMRVDVVAPAELPVSLEDIARYDAVFFSDVDAIGLTTRQMEQYRDYVRFMGGGFCMAGGPESFGAGGYYRTPIEEALPVTMDIKHEKHMPSLALVFCIDKSGSMSEETATSAQKIELAKEGAVLTAELLGPQDWIGCVGFDSAAKWVLPLRKADDPRAIAEGIRTLRAGGGTDMYPAVLEAYEALRGVNAQIKHIIVLSDGITNPANFPALVPKIVAEKITISTVATGAGADVRFMEELAKEGGGRSFFARSVAQVPRIFTKDALMATRALIVTNEQGIPLEARLPSPLLKGLDSTALPPVFGFVQTSPKDRADVILTTPKDETLLATWQYGLGRSIAWTPDLKSAWSRAWVRSSVYDPFWVQAAKWIGRTGDHGGFRTDVFLSGGRGKVVVEAFDETGEYRNFLDLRAITAGPDGSGRMLTLRQTAPGHYEAEFDALKAGPYFATIAERGAGAGDTGSGTGSGSGSGSGTGSGSGSGTHGGTDGELTRIATAGAVQSYPAEYRDLEPNPGLLRRLAEIGGGAFWQAGEAGRDVFRRTGAPVRTFAPLWFHLIAAAAALLLLDVATRRLVLPDAVRRFLAWRPAAAATPRAEVLERLKRRKEAVRAGDVPERGPAAVGAAAGATSGQNSSVSPELIPNIKRAVQPLAAGISEGRGAGTAVARAAEPAGLAPAPTPEPPTSPTPPGEPPRPAAPVPEGTTETTSRLLQAKRRARGG